MRKGKTKLMVQLYSEGRYLYILGSTCKGLIRLSELERSPINSPVLCLNLEYFYEHLTSVIYLKKK